MSKPLTPRARSLLQDSPFLIIAQSGRALARSAYSGGYGVHVLDRFADVDTRVCSRSVRAVAGDESGFDAVALAEAAERVTSRYPNIRLVFGSGFEHCPKVLDHIAGDHPLFGNPPELVRAMKEPTMFFGLLKRLGIDHPQTHARMKTDCNGEKWLSKRTGGAGGQHIVWYDYNKGNLSIDHYLQRHISGETLSVVFLTDGRRAKVAGFSRIWCAAGASVTPFRYGGAVGLPAISTSLRSRITEIVQSITAASGLRGLCGLDFILDVENRIRVLEVNPRPPATFELHEENLGLFRHHIRACLGRLPDRLFPRRENSRAHAVVYAATNVQIPGDWSWPPWVADRPLPGTRIALGQPVCTVYAQALSPAKATQKVQGRAARLWTLLRDRQRVTA